MTVLTRTSTATETATKIMPLVGVVVAAVFLIFAAGFAQATVFHDAAHDTRHTLAFPCH